MGSRRAPCELGIEVLLDRRPRWLRGERLGLVCHPASVDRQVGHSADRLREAVGKRLVALFGPQHGARGERQDNMVESPDYRDWRLGVPVYSLYGTVREPTEEMLRDVDVLLVDLQDVGTRVYTFVSTMIACLRAAARFKRKVVVLERPNPIGGEGVEGHALEPAFRSFVGEVPGLPMRHGMTMGELTRLANAELAIGCDLEIVPMRGWHRRDYWDDLGRHWVAPSPNMPTPATALCYPGSVLFEGTNVSEGRGTTQPFELIGAPFIDPHRLAAHMNLHRLPGVCLRPAFFEPTYHKWHGQLCGGVQIHVLDRRRFEPYRTALVLLAAIRRLWPRPFQWRPPPYEYEQDRMPIDLICGTCAVRRHVAAGSPPSALHRSAHADATRFRKEHQRYLLYD
jgi:uncharacterized protein YbbC (DUF1343 family)